MQLLHLFYWGVVLWPWKRRLIWLVLSSFYSILLVALRFFLFFVRLLVSFLLIEELTVSDGLWYLLLGLLYLFTLCVKLLMAFWNMLKVWTRLILYILMFIQRTCIVHFQELGVVDTDWGLGILLTKVSILSAVLWSILPCPLTIWYVKFWVDAWALRYWYIQNTQVLVFAYSHDWLENIHKVIILFFR